MVCFPELNIKPAVAIPEDNFIALACPQFYRMSTSRSGTFLMEQYIDANQRLVSPDWQPDRGQIIQSGQVFWGDCLLEVDRQACQIVGEAIPNYLQAIQKSLWPFLEA
jgi:hypothetical protein